MARCKPGFLLIIFDKFHLYVLIYNTKDQNLILELFDYMSNSDKMIG